MTSDRLSTKSQLEKLVHYFEQNIISLKSSSFNETQTRQQLIDPFFEALGWDVHNRAMKPLYLQEVLPEWRVKTTLGKEVREQTALFEAKETLGKAYKEYSSILDYIAEEEYRVSAKEAAKKPDYRFRIKGQTKFFVEAKKPFVDLVKNQDAIFQIKRYGFSGRVPVSILTDFEEFRVFDCTRKPFYDKPKLGVIKEFDLTFKQYLDLFDRIYETFSREAIEGGSIEVLMKKSLEKRTGEFALDKTFLDDLSAWREELAREIAKHPKNRRMLNDSTLNECVQRILDRIVFFRVCEDREIEVENTLLSIIRMWKERPGLSLYALLNRLFLQRRDLYNGLLFSPHQCEQIEVSDKVLLKILENLNYPFSPYNFNEIGVEILGSIYEKFLGKTIHMTAKTVRVEEKPEVRKAGGVYYTPQYIVNYIVESTLGKLLYEEPPRHPELVSGSNEGGKYSGAEPSSARHELSNERKLKLNPEQVSKLKIIDIACGSGSFLLGAFQKLIDYHIEWYRRHPKDIKEVHSVPDAYADVQGNLRLSSRKKRDILVNNIYGVDIDRQAVEVTQMSLYLKVLEAESAETLNPQLTLALKEAYLPELSSNIKCGNSLIGTDIGAQKELFDSDIMRKINPFDWEVEFKEIMESGEFDCVIGNPPYVRPHNLEYYAKDYYWNHYKTFVKKSDLYCCFIQKALEITKNKGLISYIVSDGWLRLDSFENMREFVLSNCQVLQLVELPDKVFEDATVKTGIFVFEMESNQHKSKNNLIEIRKFNEGIKIFETLRRIPQAIFTATYKKIFDTSLSPEIHKIKTKLLNNSVQIGKLVDVRFGLKTGDDSKFITKKPLSKKYKPLLRGENVQRYSFEYKGEYVWYVPEKMRAHRQTARPGESERFEQPKILIKDTSSKLGGTFDIDYYYVKDVLILTKKQTVKVSLQFILGILNSSLMSFYYESTFPTLHVQNEEISSLPIRTVNLNSLEEKKMHDELVSLVDKMLDLHKHLQKANFQSEREPIERQIAATDKKIDELVYKLYGLTEEEIRLVES